MNRSMHSRALDIPVTRRLSGRFNVLYESVAASASKVSVGSVSLDGLHFPAGVRLPPGKNRAGGRSNGGSCDVMRRAVSNAGAP